MLLTNLKEMNIIFSKAILSGGGRIKDDYKFNGSNLGMRTFIFNNYLNCHFTGVSFKITDSDENSFEHSSGLKIIITIIY